MKNYGTTGGQTGKMKGGMGKSEAVLHPNKGVAFPTLKPMAPHIVTGHSLTEHVHPSANPKYGTHNASVKPGC